MLSHLHKNLKSNLTLKISSSIFGFLMWCMLGHHHTITRVLLVPVCFYNINNKYTITAPETISITLAGKRTDIYWFDTSLVCIHIDAQPLKKGHTMIPITADKLFLPETLKLVDYSPSALAVTVEELDEPQLDIPLHE